ncbi:hypothetical protein EDEG_03229 [Edhazardia aedis USNM 41457]|uniref:SET domain-containing protein n=1 Tax=Edhazardia aedis (strain USNM 41457) TaxID=1003232 RepID=J9DLS3_EDHAE|nr:hypothetical protein EDEG_03229 [Edhazardia aedis USNM 41457]|eukprot:EJW02327.1 hypothetical protein EDEG_03229 [Edhazardia aedis USNM 41457]
MDANNNKDNITQKDSAILQDNDETKNTSLKDFSSPVALESFENKLETSLEAQKILAELKSKNQIRTFKRKKLIERKLKYKEIRQRGFQHKGNVKMGIKIDEEADFGDFICFFDGKLFHKKEVSDIRKFPFIYFFEDFDLAVVSPAKLIRRGCRPNCFMEIISFEGQIDIGIFANRSIIKNEELIIGYDYDHGNNLVDHGCCCLNMTHCLDPNRHDDDLSDESNDVD